MKSMPDEFDVADKVEDSAAVTEWSADNAAQAWRDKYRPNVSLPNGPQLPSG